MSAEVGGELKAVPTRRSLFGPDYVRLAVLLLCGIAVHGWLIAHTAIPARDSLGYARIAVNFSDPNRGEANPEKPHQRIEVIREAEQPPGYPLAIWLTEKFLRCCTSLSLADRSLLATQIANATAAVLLVVPMYLIGRMLFGRNIGFAGALLFQVLPVPARVTSDGLSEGLYLLAAATAVMFGVRAGRRPGIGGFLVCGLATGACYLVRPEGLLIGIAVGLVIAAAGISRSWPRDVALSRLVALGVGIALVAVPYMVLIGKFTKKTTAGDMLQVFSAPQPIWKGQEPNARAPGGAAMPLFADWWDPIEDAGRNRVVWALEAVWGEMIKALHYVVGAWMLIGVFANRRRLFVPDWGLWVMLVLSGLSITLMVYLAARVGYVSERHTVLLVMLCSIIAPTGLKALAEFVIHTPVINRIVLWPKALPAVFFAILVMLTVPYAMKPLHPHREGHKHAGHWLAEHMNEKDWLQDPLAWAEWYAGRTVYKTVSYHGHPEYIWVVIENGKKSPHSRIPQYEEALQRVRESGEKPRFRWPEDAPAEGPAVEVYKVKNTGR